MRQNRSSVIILYHFFYPDDVVSARHYSQFAEGLVEHGWQVTVLTSNRYCRNSKEKIPNRNELWQGIQIIRIRRPALDQANKFLRIVNSMYMMIAWAIRICKLPRADVIIIGSDPQFSALMFPVLRILRRGKVLVHWCYDLYPEAIIADGTKGVVKWIAKKLIILMRLAYQSADLVVDIGECMKKRLSTYHHSARSVTLVPWALVESDSIQKADEVIRRELFSDAKLALLYSGNMGLAHDYLLFLQLARRLYREDPKIVFCFACRGNRYRELAGAVKPDDYNIRFAPFVEEHQLSKRLNSADIHLISLRAGWEGVVVPSKFFSSLAVGRPVLYTGPEGSAIYKWIKEFNIGIILNKENMEDVANELINLSNQPDKMRIWGENAFQAYKYFSRIRVTNKWDKLLHDLLNYNTNCDVSNHKIVAS